jgi:hypothetical protein
MSQEDKPRFSHITVGQTEAGDLAHAEEEEIIAIGAVDVEADAEAPVPLKSDASIEDSGDTQNDVRSGSIGDSATDEATDGIGPRVARDTHAEESLADQDVTPPMPLVQKLVLVGCLIGLVCTVAFLIWFRVN